MFNPHQGSARQQFSTSLGTGEVRNERKEPSKNEAQSDLFKDTARTAQ
jgi:hypothetical protein